MFIIRIATKHQNANKPAVPAGRCRTYLAAKLISLMSRTLADTFDPWLMDTVHFVLIASLLGENPLCHL